MQDDRNWQQRRLEIVIRNESRRNRRFSAEIGVDNEKESSISISKDRKRFIISID